MSIAELPLRSAAALDEQPAPAGTHPSVLAWVEQIAAVTTPDSIHWCDGSRAEADHLIRNMVDAGTLIRVNAEHRPNSFVARSDPRDVARVESSTYLCTTDEVDAGPTNNWIAPKAMRKILDPLFAGSMKGRTMYVVPFSMGPLGSPLARLGVQVTDSPYVVVSTGILTRMGTPALEI